MKHHYGEWEEDPETGDAYTICTRCKVMSKIANRQTSKKFKVNGVWVTKVPSCISNEPTP